MDPYLDYPRIVHIETMAVCNAACSFCPYPTMDRIGSRMSDEFIEKILTDLEDMPPELPFEISPFKINEPFLDVRLIDILKDINTRLPQAGLRMFSNGSPLTSKTLDRLSEIRNVRYLWISLNHYEEKAYGELMKLPFSRTLQRLDSIHERELPFQVVTSRVSDLTEADDAFCTFVEDRWPKFTPVLISQHGWLGSNVHPSIPTVVPNERCNRWHEIEITATGRVALCCVDAHAEFPLGDIHKQHILDVYNAPFFKQMRAGKMTRLAYDPCNRCTYR